MRLQTNLRSISARSRPDCKRTAVTACPARNPQEPGSPFIQPSTLSWLSFTTSVNIGSIAGIQPYATGTIYSGSKHAVHGFSESLRLDYAGTGIRVTEILPGMVRTDFAMTRWNDDVKAAAFYDKTEQCLTPEDIAQTVVFALEQPPHVVLSQMVVLPSSG